MELTSLLSILRKGYSYDASDPNDMEQRIRVGVPPNKYMLRAAQVISKLYNDNETLVRRCLELQQENLKLRGINDDQTQVQNTESSTADSQSPKTT